MEWRIAVYNDVCLLTVNLYRECNSVKLNNKILIPSDRTEITAVSAAMKMVDEYSVWRFGRDITINQKIKSELPDGIKVGEISALLNQCADKVEDSLLNLDAQVIPGIKDQLAWESSLLADRSPWAGDLHLNSARYLVLDIIIARGGHHIFFIDDVVDAFALATENQFSSGIYNLGAGISTSVLEMCRYAEQIVYNSSDLTQQLEKETQSSVSSVDFWADIEKTKEHFGWEPKTSLLNGITKTWDYINTL